MRISAFCTAVLTYVVIGHPPPAVAQVDQQRAQEYFKESPGAEPPTSRTSNCVELCKVSSKLADKHRRLPVHIEKHAAAGSR